MPSPEITVLLADDHPLALEGVRSILNEAPDVKIVGENRTAVRLSSWLQNCAPISSYWI